MITKRLVFGACLVCCFSVGVQAQNNTEPFSYLDISFLAEQNINRNAFHQYWEGSLAPQLQIETPFYFGDIFIGGRYVDFSAKSDSLPGIHNLDVLVGWGIKYPFLKRVHIGASIGLSYSLFSFKNLSKENIRYGRVYGTTSPESEIGILYKAELSYQITPKWGLLVNWNRSVIYTKKKLKLQYLGIGIQHKIATPAWLRKVLR